MSSRPRQILMAVPAALAVALGLLSLSLPLSLPPRPSAAELEEAARLLRDDRFREALRATSRLASAHPVHGGALALHGLALMRSGEPELAGRALRRAAEADPSSCEARLGLGRLALGRNRIQESLDYLTLAASCGRLRREASDALRGALVLAGRIDEALRVARASLELGEAGGERGRGELLRSIDYLESLGDGAAVRVEGEFRGTVVRLLEREERRGRGIREIPVLLNGQGPFPFDIDSAYRGNLTLSPALADRLGLERRGSFPAVGIGTEQRASEVARLESLAIGDLRVENVPVMVLDSPTFRGQEKGLLGTGLLRRFDCTIDVDAGTLEIRPPGRPPRQGGAPDPDRVALRAPLVVEGGPMIAVKMGRGRPKPFLIDTAAGVTLLDDDDFEASVKPAIDPSEIQRITVRGMGGSEEALLLPSAELSIEGRSFGGLRVVILDLERISRIGRRYTGGILGINLLWRYRVHLDFSVPELILEERATAPAT